MAFKKNNKLASGGKREGAGRPADWFKQKCADILDKHDLVGFLGKVASGVDIEQGVGPDGEVLQIPASVKDRIRAVELLKEWGIGKTPQPVEHSGSIDMNAEEAKKQLVAGVSEFLCSIKSGIV